MDFSALTSAVDATTIVTAIVAVGGLTILGPLALTGVRWIKSAVRQG